MSNNNNNSNTRPQVTVSDAKAKGPVEFIIGGQKFESPEAFMEFHQQTAVEARAMQIRKENDEMAELVAELVPGDDVPRKDGPSMFQRAKSAAENITISDIVYGVAIGAAALGAGYCAYKAYEHFTSDADLSSAPSIL